MDVGMRVWSGMGVASDARVVQEQRFVSPTDSAREQRFPLVFSSFDRGGAGYGVKLLVSV